jgi:hypothetical protein
MILGLWEHGVSACPDRQLAGRISLVAPVYFDPFPDVRGKLPRTTGWQPALPMRKLAR